ncbi:MAG: AMP-binding protein, partial [bacterium]|nr:AMP-binding protein [bacterium]
LLAYVHSFFSEFDITETDKVMQVTSFTFDAFVEEMYPALLKGGTIAIPTREEVLDTHLLSQFIHRHGITFTSCSPLLLNELNKYDTDVIGSMRIIISGGDVLKTEHVDGLLQVGHVYNTYGPTETTVCVTYHRHLSNPRPGPGIPIGKPIANYNVYILDEHSRLQPPGVPGELCVTGAGITRGYLNNPQQTAEKFISHSPNTDVSRSVSQNTHGKTQPPGESSETRLYKTGDLCRWLEDGSIEFLGRIDQQVKIRGYRIELGEIESHLSKHSSVETAAVLVREDNDGDRYLCAYIVTANPEESQEGENAPSMTETLRTHSMQALPGYMIPPYFIQVDRIPRTAGGKIDRGNLPLPRDVLKKDNDITPPRNRAEQKLARIWEDVLFGEESENTVIGIDSNFFEMGGHSLKAITLLAKINKGFDVNIPLATLFEIATIRELADYMKDATIDKYESIEPAEKKEYYPLSPAQERLYILRQLTPGGTVYNMPRAIPMEAPDTAKLEQAFQQVIKRHDSLRTSFQLIDEKPVQVIHDAVPFELEYFETGADGHSIQNSFVRPFDLSQAPLLRAVLVELDNTDNQYILLVDMHHIISDGVSLDVLERDFAAFYEGKEMPALRLQYKDYSEWQIKEEKKGNIKIQETYWLKQFEDEIPVLELPLDYPRPAVQRFEGDSVNFSLSGDETKSLKAMALAGSSTTFMLLLAVFNTLLAKLGNPEDIIIGTPVAGRRHADLEKIIGMFVNTLALRNFPEGEKTFKEFFQEVKGRTLDAFENQEYQFETLVANLPVNRDTGRNPLFDVMFSMQTDERRNAAPSIEKKSPAETVDDGQKTLNFDMMPIVSKFDMTLTALESAHRIAFNLTYNTALFKKETAKRFAAWFKRLIAGLLTGSDKKLSQLD